MGVVWSSLTKKLRSLPTAINDYTQYRQIDSLKNYRFTMQIKEQKAHRFVADMEWLDESGKVVAAIHGYEAVMDASLESAFEQSNVSSEAEV